MTRLAGYLSAVALWLLLAGAFAGAEEKADPEPKGAAQEKPEPKQAPPAKAQPKAGPAKKAEAAPTKPDEPMHMWGDRMRYVSADSLALVTANVTLIKGTFRLDCDHVRGILDPTTNRFKKIYASGNVRMCNVIPIAERTNERPPVQPAPEPRKGSCEAVEYDLATDIVILTGPRDKQPLMTVNKDQVQADRIVYDRKKDLVTFEGKVRLSAMTPKAQEKLPAAPEPAPAPK